MPLESHFDPVFVTPNDTAVSFVFGLIGPSQERAVDFASGVKVSFLKRTATLDHAPTAVFDPTGDTHYKEDDGRIMTQTPPHKRHGTKNPETLGEQV